MFLRVIQGVRGHHPEGGSWTPRALSKEGALLPGAPRGESTRTAPCSLPSAALATLLVLRGPGAGGVHGGLRLWRPEKGQR